MEHKGWHSRGYLPHLDAPGEIQALTFRLKDAVPEKVIDRWRSELAHDPDSSRERKLRVLISRYEDAGHGSCLLRQDAHARTVQESLFHADGLRYRLLEWCVMPNHVHVLIQPVEGMPLGQIVRTWKTYSAKMMNAAEGTSGSVWAEDYHDRYIRDLDHLLNARLYIRNNPMKAGLCEAPEAWRWSSAFPGDQVEA
ncbi:MAG TPA: transposase [Haloferula sp.]